MNSAQSSVQPQLVPDQDAELRIEPVTGFSASFPPRGHSHSLHLLPHGPFFMIHRTFLQHRLVQDGRIGQTDPEGKGSQTHVLTAPLYKSCSFGNPGWNQPTAQYCG